MSGRSADRTVVASEQREPSFYSLGDEALNAHATAAPLRTPQHGRADIGGRMRVAAILRDAGIPHPEHPVRIAGATNEVWRAGDYVVRVGFVPGADRLRREAQLAAELPYDVHYPKVIASGLEPFGEWIIVKHRPGVVLSAAWGQMDVTERKSVIADLAAALRSVHSLRLDSDRAESLMFHEGAGRLALPHQLPVERILALLDSLKGVRHVDSGLLAAAEERTRSVADAIWAHERHGLVHGDLHFENILVKDAIMVSLLDFEWCRPGPAEIDLDVLARFCAHPHVHVGGSYYVEPKDYRNVLRMLNEAYPELFAHERLVDRLTLCALAFEVPSLAALPPDAPSGQLSEFHPINRLKDLLDNGTHAERLGWEPEPAF